MERYFQNKQTVQRGCSSSSSRVKPLVSLVFDDGYRETFKNALPLLREYRLRATFAVCVEPGHIERSESLRCARQDVWEAARKQGHEIASHTITHRALTSLSLEEVRMELRNSAKILGARSLVYPGGAYNQEVQKIARKFYLCARGVEEGINTLPIYNFYGLKSVLTLFRKGWRRFQERQRIKSYIKRVAREGGWLILSYHLVTQAGEEGREYKFRTRVKDFKRHLDWLKEYNLNILPLGEAAELLKPPLSTTPGPNELC